MVIDVHAHIGRYGAVASTPASLDAWAAAQGIDCVLVSNVAAAATPVQADDRDEVDANLACLEACKPFPRLRPLYWVRPARRDSNVHALAGALACEPFAGAVFSPVWNDFLADAPVLDAYLRVLTAMGLPAFIHCGRDERAAPERIYTLAKRNGHVRIVLYDALADAHRDDAIRVALRCAHRGDARVLLDTANADPAVVLAAIEKAGPQCIVHGSDACMWNTGAARDLAASALGALRAALADDVFGRVTGQNAHALFNPAPALAAAAAAATE
jgi:predicted TIM-barrel fold metal-dependent hydrolase